MRKTRRYIHGFLDKVSKALRGHKRSHRHPIVPPKHHHFIILNLLLIDSDGRLALKRGSGLSVVLFPHVDGSGLTKLVGSRRTSDHDILQGQCAKVSQQMLVHLCDVHRCLPPAEMTRREFVVHGLVFGEILDLDVASRHIDEELESVSISDV